MRQILTAILWLYMGATHAGSYVYQQNGAIAFRWWTSDEFSLFTSSGTIMPHTVKSIDSNDGHFVTTECIGWAFEFNNAYYACYPYSVNHKLLHSPYTALPITYINQTQTANNNTEHLTQKDFMTAHGTTGATVNPVELTYTHLGSIMRIAAFVPETKTFSSLTLTTKDNTAWFAEEATMNATNNTMTPTATAASATLSLNNITVAAGDSLIAYLMTAPADLSGKSIMITLNADDGSALQAYAKGCNMKAGCVYPLSIGRENYFRTQRPTTPDEDSDTEEILSLQLNIEGNEATDTQITTATAYAPDFAPDAENKMTSFLLGDVNLDGTVDVTDVVIVVNHFQNDTTDELDFNVADIDGDGVIDVTDVVGIVNIYHRR